MFLNNYIYLFIGGPSTNVLMQVPVPVLDNSVCKKAFVNNKKTIIDERVICAGYLAGGKDACQVLVINTILS